MEPINRTILQTDWITITLFTSFICVLIAKSFDYTRFVNFIILPFNNKYITIYTKKEKLFNWFHILISLFQIINTTLFIYFIWREFLNTGVVKNPFLFPILLVVVFLFITLKTVVQLANGFVFNSYKTFNELIFKKLTYLNYSGIVLCIANIFLTYVAIDHKIIIIIGSVLFIAINIIGWLTVLRNYQNFISSYFFYFILYLCALEIAPLVIMGSFLK
ncbi:DUF4271 domain-containing protein [Maribacter sp. MAR_2009_72]|uniref:DUF4271 domain-containing protein n=1 Tax=Maribacter sp. MAR_2009_72 TaxID=1250050 RepID=UPI00119B542F|nr:DUF4271 domain-containing protein [Maribacter sp. MAR_2009_72]TVZ15752.1 uncharacterized protein DUF4271 [Maribacter sp. MAR_2009_72]